MMDTVVFVDSQAIDFFLNDVVLAKVNAEVDTLLAKEYNISGYPTGILIGSDGKEIDRLIGYAPTKEFIKILKDYQQGIGTLEDLLNRSKTEKDRSLYYEIADKYKYRGGNRDALHWYNEVLSAGEATDSVSGNARLAIADMYRRGDKYTTALEEYKKIEKEFEGKMHGMDAVIYQAIVYRSKGDTTKSISIFRDYIKRFPESPDIDYAERSIKKLLGEDTGS